MFSKFALVYFNVIQLCKNWSLENSSKNFKIIWITKSQRYYRISILGTEFTTWQDF